MWAHLTHTFQYRRSRIMWLFTLRISRLRSSCSVVLCPSSGTMASSRCSISGLTAVTGWSERGKSENSTFPASKAVSPFTQCPTELTPTVELPQTLQRLIISRQQEILSQHVVGLHFEVLLQWCYLSEIFTTSYMFHLKISQQCWLLAKKN